MVSFILFFFFSSRRRHTRYIGDWSSDVCSSDLFSKLVQTPEYKDYMEKQALKPIFLTGKDMVQFLEEDGSLNKQLMTEEIGRASCRERVEISVGAGGVKKKRKNSEE